MKYNTGIDHLTTAAEVGAYNSLIVYLNANGSLPAADRMLNVVRMTAPEWQRCRERVLAKVDAERTRCSMNAWPR
jgi:hypothetical protein